MIVVRPAAELRAETGPRLADLIIVDDNPGDVTLFRSAVSEVGLPVHVHAAEDAAEFFALMRLFIDPPALVLLDLNLPLLNGSFILSEIREDRVWQDVPVVILTSSSATGDLIDCRHLGATDFITKPSLFDGYIDVVRGLARYLEPAGATAAGRQGAGAGKELP